MSIFLDAHVHIYPEFPVEQLLDAALQNFSQAAGRLGDTEPRDYLLCLTENYGVNVFRQLQELAHPVGSFDTDLSLPAIGAWQYCAVSEPHCLLARNSEGNRLYIFAGRQLISSERLELLSLCTPVDVPDKIFPLEELAEKVWDSGGIPLLTWGVGKWLGKRGEVVDRFIADSHDFPVVLGDNGNRPGFWPEPRQFSIAAKNNQPLISGSDPLPLLGHNLRVGSFGGWVANRRIDPACPVTDLKSIFTQPGSVMPFGKKTSVVQFFRDQLLVNARKRLPTLFS